ncbi:MAG TPA: fimbrillin family protein [Candidatus Bacteroides intestinavium]|uniref:Fimbrillin family protein n=1 Tax=Candidatus Bacteroides intestinavium TaxID=2838469 RepID=A0A9D2KRS8_9BACE|nr:fimbrillin family protein [Candidatus Bacteroides intestinavium]
MTTRHYSLIKGFALATLMPLFAACSSENDATVPGGEAQPVQIDITRATTDGNDWTWENGDQLKLYVTSYGSDAPTEETLAYNGSTWSTFIVTLPATVEACYPATATLTSFTIPTNQSAGIAGADYMTTASSQQLNGNDLSLALVHRLCKVAVTISGYEDYSGTPAVESEVFNSYLTVNYNNDAWTGTGELTSVTPFKTESSADGHHTYQAIVAPASSYSPFMTLKVNGKDRTVNCNQALVSGNAYTFNLTVRNPDAATRSAGISDYELELVEVRDLNEE